MPVKKTMITAALLMAAPMVDASSVEVNEAIATVVAPLNSIACYGSVVGTCKIGSEALPYNEFVTKHLGKPVVIEKIHYFSNRDDKVILEFSDLEATFSDAFMKLTLTMHLNNMQNFISPKPIDKFMAERRETLRANCPVENGCQNAMEFLAALENSNK